ncbi:unnamed protein product [Anisakis simplex]|uniref:Monocarboxylate transporter n=1 Tax=Anisakis simplex TaxID=6269 RepID=A0A0M3J7E6_ANISI|nr:unnamed protein product [Anisakis simplex]
MYEDFGWDGILILRIILSNAGQMACVATVYELYKKINANLAFSESKSDHKSKSEPELKPEPVSNEYCIQV